MIKELSNKQIIVLKKSHNQSIKQKQQQQKTTKCPECFSEQGEFVSNLKGYLYLKLDYNHSMTVNKNLQWQY